MNSNIEITANKKSIILQTIILCKALLIAGLFVIIQKISYVTGITFFSLSLISIYLIYSKTFNLSITNHLVKVYGAFSKKIIIENFLAKDIVIKSFWTKQEVKKLAQKNGTSRYEANYPRVIFLIGNQKFEFRNITHQNFEHLIDYSQNNLSEAIDIYIKRERQNEKNTDVKRVFLVLGLLLLFFVLLTLEQKYFL
ncbi:hypothetical protein [Sporocytophaga myxococcoides]|uniref:hypothetical protein n=1 Tax=Sporocytophaga myxococcoides TaxID=153721 RepID=UPI0003FDA329|nr:hypothetical protein [Sporocytophaga myxococcoides]